MNSWNEIEKGIHEIVQAEVAGEMWYESRLNEERLQKLLQNMEKQLGFFLKETADKAYLRGREEGRLEFGWDMCCLMMLYHDAEGGAYVEDVMEMEQLILKAAKDLPVKKED